MQKGNKPNFSCDVNLSKEHIINDFVLPYRSNKRLLCDGDIFEASELMRLKFYFTSDKIEKMTDRMEISGFLHNNAKHVTRELFDDAKIKSIEAEKSLNSDKIFIVHGQDNESKLELARMIENDLGLDAIILHEQANRGNTIIEKLERLSELPSYVFVILTPDDSGANNVGKVNLNNRNAVQNLELKHRARQNVILELEYFMGKLGRERVCCLYKGNVEIPSDIMEVLYLKFQSNIGECYGDIRKELISAGFSLK